jgi:uncharacterized membrane protein
MKKKWNWSRILLATTAVALLVSGSILFAAKGGNKPGGGDPPQTNVRYDVVWLGTLGGSKSGALSVNNIGEIVGYSFDANETLRATIFAATGPIDLNDVMANLIFARNDGPWTAWPAAGINDLGQITGSIRPPSGTSHPFIYDPGNSARPRSLEILPQLFDASMRATGINNLGEIAGHYLGNGGGSFVYSPGGTLIDMEAISIGGDGCINDVGQVVFFDHSLGASWRYTPDSVLGDIGTFEKFPGAGLTINSSGEVAGTFRTETRKGRNKFIENIYQAASPDSIQVIYQGQRIFNSCYRETYVHLTHKNVSTEFLY